MHPRADLPTNGNDGDVARQINEATDGEMNDEFIEA